MAAVFPAIGGVSGTGSVLAGTVCRGASRAQSSGRSCSSRDAELRRGPEELYFRSSADEIAAQLNAANRNYAVHGADGFVQHVFGEAKRTKRHRSWDSDRRQTASGFGPYDGDVRQYAAYQD